MKKKRILAIVLSMTLMTAAAGCGKSTDQPAASDAAKTESAAAVSSAVSEAAGEAADTASAGEEIAASAAEALEEKAAAAAESASEAAVKAAGAVESQAEEAAETAESGAEALAGKAAAAESLAEDVQESVLSGAESLAEDVQTSDAESGPVSSDTAFVRAWQQISEQLTRGYAEAYALPEKLRGQMNEDAVRISLDPDALNLLGLATETLADVDLSWVEEIGIDLVPATEAYKRPNYAMMYSYNSGAEQYMTEYLGSGMSGVLHVNGEEIASADFLIDEANRVFRLRLPELVSGEYVDMSSYRSYLESFGRQGSDNPLIQAAFYTGAPASMIWQLMTRSNRLLPEPELLREILATEDSLWEGIPADREEALTLEAGAVTEDSTAYTGRIPARDLAKAAELLLDRFENDESFRSDVISYVDTYAAEFKSSLVAQNLIITLTRTPLGRMLPGLHQLDPRWIEQDLTAQTALLTGKWEIREGAFEDAARREAEAVESAESEESDEESTEDTYDPRKLTLTPGAAMSLEEVKNVDSDQLSLMKQAIRRQDIILEENWSLGQMLDILYEYYAPELREALKAVSDSLPEDVYAEITCFFNGEGSLNGLGASVLQLAEDAEEAAASAAESAAEEVEEAEDRVLFSMPLFELTWPSDGESRAVMCKAEAVPSGGAEILLEELQDAASGKQELRASGQMADASFNAELLNDPEARRQYGRIAVNNGYGQNFTAEAEHTDDADSGSEHFEMMMTDPESGEEALRAEVDKEPAGGMDVWSGQLLIYGEVKGTLKGYYDWTNGEADFTCKAPIDNRTSLEAGLHGTIDLESGDSTLRLTFRDMYSAFGSYAYGSYSNISVTVDVETERLSVSKDGTLEGIIRLTGEMTGRDVENMIPKGLMLILDFDENAVRIGDRSGTYLTISELEESEYLSHEEAHARIREMCETDIRSAMMNDTGTLGSNWNVLLPLNRLLKAGMPKDFLKSLSSNEELQGMLEDIMYDIQYGW